MDELLNRRGIEVELFKDFDYISYLNSNKNLLDVNINSYDSAYHHYKYYGSNLEYERVSFEAFDYMSYIKLNNILNIDNKVDAWNDWRKSGYNKIYIHSNNNINELNYLDKVDEFGRVYLLKRDDILNNAKNEFRYFCYNYLEFIRNINLPFIKQNNKLEAVLIEYRCFPHIEFILRNNIYKLGSDWSFTIVCGNLNYEYLKSMIKDMRLDIKLIRTYYNNLNQSSYSKLLTSTYFWNLLNGDKILIYQEDSLIFKNNIIDFLEYDYIGAPWPITQNDNEKCVGNGGLSLRTKKCMLDTINKISILDTVFNTHTLEYMKNSGQTIGPEDVYFTLNMIKYNIGVVSNYDVASFFSSELIYNENSLGGHNFWLCTDKWKDFLYKHILYKSINLFKILAITTPYNLRIGGGESYLLNFARYFINYKNCIVLLFSNESNINAIKTICQILGNNYVNYFRFYKLDEIYLFSGKVDYHFDMLNIKNPVIKGLSNNIVNNYFHCQFPFDKSKVSEINYINTYGNIIINSEFTEKYYKIFNKKNILRHRVHILYPNCISEINILNRKYNKIRCSFVMIGRIFDYNLNANNKNFDIILKVFERINKVNENFEVHIIGQVYSNNMLNKLKEINIKNIYFHCDASEEEKLSVIEKCEYIINAVGINRDKEEECYAYEHFGISLIEALNNNCIPISINGGFPSYYINSSSGLLYNNMLELYDILESIIIKNISYNFNSDYYINLLNKFSLKSYNNSLKDITLSN